MHSALRYQHDYENLKFNILQVGRYEICVSPRLFDFNVCIATPASKKDGEFIATFPVSAERLQLAFSAVYQFLHANPDSNLEELVHVPGFWIVDHIDSYYFPNFPIIEILTAQEIFSIAEATNNITHNNN